MRERRTSVERLAAWQATLLEVLAAGGTPQDVAAKSADAGADPRLARALAGAEPRMWRTATELVAAWGRRRGR